MELFTLLFGKSARLLETSSGTVVGGFGRAACQVAGSRAPAVEAQRWPVISLLSRLAAWSRASPISKRSAATSKGSITSAGVVTATSPCRNPLIAQDFLEL